MALYEYSVICIQQGQYIRKECAADHVNKLNYIEIAVSRVF